MLKMSQYSDVNTLPSGWECKQDNRTGKPYFINHITKTTTWDDPRQKHKNYNVNHIEYVPPQPTHGSPYHVYPYPSPIPLLHAFQPGPPHQFITSSNTYSPKALPKQLTDLVGSRGHITPLSGGSPVFGRGVSLTPKDSPLAGKVSQLSTKIQETLTLNTDTDALVAKIGTMFPTVSETHIRLLLKKYYNREAVVISALQVEKHPIATPGPVATPPSVPRLHSTAVGVYSALQLAKGLGNNSPQMTPPLGGSPRGSPPLRPSSGGSSSYIGSPRSIDTYRNSPRQHSSPKMKLRYLKSLFPKAEETLILDILANEDNNVQKSSEKLISMGYVRRETMPPKISTRIKEKEPPSPIIKTPPRLKSTDEKAQMKEQIQKKYSDVPEQVVSMALESVDWSEEKADQILSVAIQEDTVKKIKSNSPKKDVEAKNPANERKVQTLGIEKKCYGSEYLIPPNGPNPKLAKGPQDQLLLLDYVPWNGANPDLKVGPTTNAKGFDIALREESKITHTLGSNPSLRKGPSGLAKGSIYQQINKNKHNLITLDSMCN